VQLYLVFAEVPSHRSSVVVTVQVEAEVVMRYAASVALAKPFPVKRTENVCPTVGEAGVVESDVGCIGRTTKSLVCVLD
jgi:hypothetical protein